MPHRNNPIVPVTLCSGSGTRLWLLSRTSYPRQFVPLIGHKSLLGVTAERLAFAGSPLLCAAAEDHHMHNLGKLKMEMIEAQSGSYLGEHDIVLLEDTYGRTR